MSSIRTLLTSTAAVLVSLASVANAQTSFTYQGRLDRAGAPEPGVFDLQFRLFNHPTAGTQQGVTICSDDVIVADDGTFTTTLDFGPLDYINPMHLEIAVRPGLDVPCTDPRDYDLLPRQPLTASPMAANALRLNGLSSSFFTDAANISSGLLADARLSSNIPRLNTNNAYSGTAAFNSFVIFFADAGFLGPTNFQAPATFTFPATFSGQVTQSSPTVYSSPIVRTLYLGAATGQPANESAFNRTVGFINGSTPGDTANIEFPITIPNAATIAGIIVYANDNSAASNYSISFQRAFLNTGAVFNIASSSPVANSPSVLALPLTFPAINVDPLNVYSVRIIYTVPADSTQMRIRGVAVTYTINAAD